MKKELNLKSFLDFVENLDINEQKEIVTEDCEGSTYHYAITKIMFCGDALILYQNPFCSVGIIQDIPVAPWEDVAADVFEMFEGEGEYKVFIEE